MIITRPDGSQVEVADQALSPAYRAELMPADQAAVAEIPIDAAAALPAQFGSAPADNVLLNAVQSPNIPNAVKERALAESGVAPVMNLGGQNQTSQLIYDMTKKPEAVKALNPGIVAEGTVPAVQTTPAAQSQMPNQMSGPSLSPGFGASQDMEQGFNLKAKGLMAAQNAAVEKANADSAYLGTLHQNLQQQEVERQQREAGRQQRLQQDVDKLNAAIEDYSKTEVDPNRLYSNMGVGQKISAVLSVMLGGYAGGVSGKGGNVGLDMLNQAIDRDISAQKIQLEKKSGLVTARTNLIGRMREIFGDERLAEKASKDAMLQNAEIKLKQIAASAESGEAKAKTLAALGDLSLERQKNQLEFANISSQIYERTATAQAKMAEAQAGPKLDQNQYAAADAAHRVENSLEIFKKLEGDGFDPTSSKYRGHGKLPAEIQSKDYQQFKQAGKEILASILRKESGAAITEDEWDEYAILYLPMPGESSEVKQQKMQGIQQRLNSFKAQGGAAYRQIGKVRPQRVIGDQVFEQVASGKWVQVK